MLSKKTYYVDENTMKTLYIFYTLIYPLLSYSVIVWGNNFPTITTSFHITKESNS